MDAGAQYEFGFTETNVYGHVFSLVERLRLTDGDVHLDLGCGFGAIAEKCREAGLHYLGLDLNAPGLNSLRERGFEAEACDLQAVETLPERLRQVIGDRRLASISMIDTLEHITSGNQVLAVLSALAQQHAGAPLVVAVPNVGHRDLAAKLAVGRWDYTKTGLLDETHVIHHTDRLLTHMAEAAGWREAGRRDFYLGRSDQFFPADLPVLGEVTTVARFLSALSAQASPFSEVNEFVRAYVPGRVSLSTLEASTPVPFLSVVIRTQGRRPEQLRDTLTCLLGQTNQDFEVLLVGHKVSIAETIAIESLIEELPVSLRLRTRLLVVDRGGRARPLNEAARLARGRYLACLDDDDLVLGQWVERFADLARRYPSQVLRVVAVTQNITVATWPGGVTSGHRTVSSPIKRYASHFDIASHFHENESPLLTLAFPMSLFHDLGFVFDEGLNVMEDWDFLLRAALLVGVGADPDVTAIYHRWTQGEASHTLHAPEEWMSAQRRIIDRLDAEPHLFPAGTIGRLLSAHAASISAQSLTLPAPGSKPQDAHHTLGEVYASRSWRATAGLRLAGRAARRVRNRLRRS